MKRLPACCLVGVKGFVFFSYYILKGFIQALLGNVSVSIRPSSEKQSLFFRDKWIYFDLIFLDIKKNNDVELLILVHVSKEIWQEFQVEKKKVLPLFFRIERYLFKFCWAFTGEEKVIKVSLKEIDEHSYWIFVCDLKQNTYSVEISKYIGGRILETIFINWLIIL